MRFFVGLHHPSDARHFGACFVSVNALRRRKWFSVGDWILDSGAFTEVGRHGGYRDDVAAYAREIERWSSSGRLLAAVAQDWMCEPSVLARTGLSVAEHQRLTIERHDALLALRPSVPILPVLQGWEPEDYARHVEAYGDRLRPDHWVGIGSVCRRNGDTAAVRAVIDAILEVSPRLRLHGFGLKTTAIRDAAIRCRLYSADSMAWSYHARMHGRDGNDPAEARDWAARFGFDGEGLNRETWRTIDING